MIVNHIFPLVNYKKIVNNLYILNTNENQEDIIFSWLPNCKDLLIKTLNQSNFVYYPYGNGGDNIFKAFDFTYNKNVIENEDDFHAIDQKQIQAKTTKKVPQTQKKTL